MKENSVFWKILVVCFVGLFLVSGVFYAGTAYCQPAEEEEEEEIQTRPRPDTKPNPMLRMKSSPTMQRARPARTTQQMKSSATIQRARPASPARQMQPASSIPK